MKQYLHAFAMCQSMFCAIPVPWKVWDEEARGKMLLFLPVIGLEIGLIWAGLAWLCGILGLPGLVSGLALCVYPFWITGFLHLDGFMDVLDAVKSCRSLERRREILKDSRVGAFAVIGLVLLVLAQFALLGSMDGHPMPQALILVPAVSRCCSSLAVTALKPMATSQYASREKNKGQLTALAVMLVLLLAAGFLLVGKYGFVALGCICGYCLALTRAYRSLEGMNGDISGYALTIAELCAVTVYALI